MSELSPGQREQIYLEEKRKREGSSSTSKLLLFLTLGAIVGVAGYLAMRDRMKGRKVSLEDLRKAYDGLAPEDENV